MMLSGFVTTLLDFGPCSTVKEIVLGYALFFTSLLRIRLYEMIDTALISVP